MHKSSPIRTFIIVFFRKFGGTASTIRSKDSPAAEAAEVEALLVDCLVNSRAILAKWIA